MFNPASEELERRQSCCRNQTDVAFREAHDKHGMPAPGFRIMISSCSSVPSILELLERSDISM